MTPELVRSFPVPETNDSGSHLSEDQFGDLLALSSAGAETDAHLRGCSQCSAELAALRGSIALFRDASRTYADNELRQLPEMKLPARRLISPAQQSAWWLAAAALLLTAVTPLQLQRMRALHTAATSAGTVATTASAQSDEALLEDVDRETSASLPSPMQTLANPSTALDASTLDTTQRKD